MLPPEGMRRWRLPLITPNRVHSGGCTRVCTCRSTTEGVKEGTAYKASFKIFPPSQALVAHHYKDVVSPLL